MSDYMANFEYTIEIRDNNENKIIVTGDRLERYLKEAVEEASKFCRQQWAEEIEDTLLNPKFKFTVKLKRGEEEIFVTGDKYGGQLKEAISSGIDFCMKQMNTYY